VGFADDLMIVVVSRTSRGLEDVVNPTLATVDTWLRSHGLQLAYEKTMLTRKWAFENPVTVAGGRPVQIKRSMKYLGVTLGSHLTFTGHIRTVSGKATKAAAAIGRLMPNVSGPTQCKKKLLMTVVSSRLLYAASTWAERVTKYVVNIKAIVRAQRVAALRVTRA